MRFKCKTLTLTVDDYGKIRKRSKFLFFPRRFNNEYKWLEFAVVIEEVKLVFNDDIDINQFKWVETGFDNV